MQHQELSHICSQFSQYQELMITKPPSQFKTSHEIHKRKEVPLTESYHGMSLVRSFQLRSTSLSPH